MLQHMRERLTGVITWVIVVTICITFALWGIHSYFGGNPSQQTVAKVGKQSISAQDLQKEYLQLRQQVQIRLKQPISEKLATLIKKQALHQLINDKLLATASKQLGLATSESALTIVIHSLPQLQENGQFSLERLKELLQINQMSYNQLADNIALNYQLNQLRQGILLSGFLLPNEIDNKLAFASKAIHFSYIIIDKNIIGKQPKITQEEINSYYRSYKNEFSLPEKVQINYILLSAKKLEQTIHPTGTELKRYYATHRTDFMPEKKWQVTPALFTKNATLKQIEKHLHEKNTTWVKTTNGIVKPTAWLNSKAISSSLKNLLNKTPLKNWTSPIPTEDGWVSYQVLSKATSKTKTFNELKGKITSAFKREQVTQKFAQMSQTLSDMSYENPDSLMPVAKKLDLIIQTTPFFSKQERKTSNSIIKNPAVIEAAFSDDVLVNGNNSDVISLKNGDQLVLRVNKHQPTTYQPLQEVNGKIRQHLIAIKEKQQLKLIVKQMLGAIRKKKQTLTQVAEKYHVLLHSSTWLRRTDKFNYPQVLIHLFSLQKRQADVYQIGQNKWLLAQLNATKQTKLNKKQKSVYIKAAKYIQQQAVLSVYLNSLRQIIPVKIYL